MAGMLEPPFLNPIFSSNSPHIQLLQKSPPDGLNFLPIRSPSNNNLTTNACSCSAENVDHGPLLPPPPLPPPQVLSQNHNLSSDRSTKDRRKVVRLAWEKLVRWSRSWRSKAKTDVLERTNKVVVLGGGSFGTAMAAHVADRKSQLEVNMLVHDPQVCWSINEKHCNFKYFPDYKLPENVIATTEAKAALLNVDFCLHDVPVQDDVSNNPSSTEESLAALYCTVRAVICTGIDEQIANSNGGASKDKKLANTAQQLLASRNLRINRLSDVTGVEIAGALKNVLAIAAGIVEGMNLGNKSMAALVAQGCSEIQWLATKMGAKSTTITSLSGTGDIILSCFVNLSRNRTVRVRLGSGENLDDILSSMNQVAEGVSTAGVVIAFAQKYNVKMPVLTSVARIIDSELTPPKAILELMRLPQVEEV